VSRSDPAVLLVEDDEGLRRILARHLALHGYTVAEAATAEDAVRSLAEGERPDVVLLDINLPGATGWDLVRGPALSRAGSPPVVVATAVTMNPRRLAELGVAGYLPKPFALETLLDTLDRLVHPMTRR
jgi:CheY-like chemotaxis protein